MSTMVLVAELNGVRIGIPAEQVRSVIEVEAATPIPLAPAHIAGLTAVRSQAMTVIDSRASIGLPASADNTDRLAIVVEAAGLFYALLLDAVHDVKLCASEATPVTGGYGGGWDRVAAGMAELDDGPILMVDPYGFIFPAAKAA